MSSGRRGARRRGLVLGAGGILGGCWAIGALRAWQDCMGWDPREADVLVGTSVGSLLSILLASGVSTPELVDDQYGLRTAGPLAGSDFDHDRALDTRFSSPRLGLGSPELLVRSLLHPLSQSPMAWYAALSARGTRSLGKIGDLVAHVLPRHEWPSHVRVVATNYDRGERTSFACFDHPCASVPDAVTASCSVPGWFPPVPIHGQRYVDGAVVSVTNADLLTASDLDEVFVLAPMAARTLDRPASPTAWLERTARIVFNRAVHREAETLRASSIAATVLAPGAEDLAVMGATSMDPRRRTEVLETALETTQRELRDAEF